MRCPGGCIERLDELIDQNVSQPPQVGDRDGVLEPRQSGLTGQIGIIGQAVGDHLEDGIGSQSIVVVLVLVVGEDAVDPLPHHAQQGLLRKVGSRGH